MAEQALIDGIGEWLIDQALAQPDIVTMFEQLCDRLYGAGIPLSRARLTWPTLHPLFQSETILWKYGEEIEFEQFKHQEEASEEWLRSPMYFMLEHDIDTLRRNLDGENKFVDFAVLDDLIEEGHTDYLMIRSAFSSPNSSKLAAIAGMFVHWSSGRPGGFSNSNIQALEKIQRRLAVACKNAIQQRVARNITETYLGTHAGSEVLEGAIKLGDGRETRAVVWYSDMRHSTSLADTMPPSEFLELLNDYFSCTAGSAIAFGGQVLDFIGDAVLAVFPYEDETGRTQAIRCATMAMERAEEEAKSVNARRKEAGQVEFDYGIGINSGTVMFGNIGVASRLAFSVIGPTVNEVERIETATKLMEAKALVTADIAAEDPDRWVSVGEHALEGIAMKCELFAPSSGIEQAVISKRRNSKRPAIN